MSDRGETREQPSIREPAGLNIEHAGLAVSVVAFTVAVGALAVEEVTGLGLLLRGAYSVLAALMVCGVVSYFGGRLLRELATVKAQRVEVRQMLRYREMLRQRRELVSVGGPHRSSREGDRSEYWSVYADVLDDLGGIARPPSEG